VGFEPTISAGERPKTYALERTATGTGTININSPNNLVKKNSQTLDRNIFLITDERYISMAAYIDLYIVIMERDGYDLTALYRHIHSITGVFKREFLWRHKQERDLREPFASINAVFPRRSA